MYTCLIYNLNVAASITSQGRALISSAGLQFEMFLANNVKFGSLNEVITFIDNIVGEKHKRKYRDCDLLDSNISVEDCFAKVVMTCGYRWIPTEDELDTIWRILYNLQQEDINRIYYKNNLYEFLSNQSMIKAIIYMLDSLDIPYMNPLDPPKCIRPEMDEFTSIMMEYVYYSYQIIDRMDRMDNMIKSICLISDTDSAIISLDAFYRFVLKLVEGMDFRILHQDIDPIRELEKDEFGDITDKRYLNPVTFKEVELDFDFYKDEIVELEHTINPLVILPQDNLRYSIINILAYTLDKVINEYMIEFTKNNHSYRGDKECKIILKNEFLFKRALLTDVKKSYATIQEIQEGNMIKQEIDTALDIKGIAAMAKSSMAGSTRDALKKIMYEDILNTPVIDQMKVVKEIAILEKQILNSLMSGSKEYYKPVVIKSMDNYEKPMSIQGIKGSVVWNAIKDDDATPFNLEERNSADIAKVNINDLAVEKIKDIYPETYLKCKRLLQDDYFKGGIDSIAIPKDSSIPEWLLSFIDHNSIINDNVSGFPLESIGMMRLENKNVNWTNILKL